MGRAKKLRKQQKKLETRQQWFSNKLMDPNSVVKNKPSRGNAFHRPGSMNPRKG